MALKQLMFLSWESPWPALSGGSLRTLGLLKELSKAYQINLVVLSQEPLSELQKTELSNYTSSITRVPMRGPTINGRLGILALMFSRWMPYHCALLHASVRYAADVLRQIRCFPGVVYASYGHWGTLVRGSRAPNWILDQHNADISFWRVYAAQTSSPWRKLAAIANWRLAAAHFSRIYASVGRIISVCEEDLQLTLSAEPHAQVSVIENGVDCSYYAPDRRPRTGPPRILFTGTSAPRNVTALRRFAHNVWPMIQREMPEAELWVGGNFRPKAQLEFRKYKNIRFTGRVEDIRPYFNQSDVFIAPFEETHGSKLKIAEAMAMGMPIVSTAKGIRGFPLIDKESVLIAYKAGQFAAYVIDLLRNPKMQEDLGKAARQAALSTIDWRVLGQRLRSIVEETYARLPVKGDA